ncbi:MAG: hypothetical protein K9N07_07355 [Candidatus Cloacimonetes bacterium]|nr:hypothetical protein [Candidatus Cloacimonadota bacterium]
MKKNDFLVLCKKAETEIANYCFFAAINTYKKALELYPQHTVFLSFQIGAIFQPQLGYGEDAKKYYLKAIEWNKKNQDFITKKIEARKQYDVIMANVYENIASLSDSFDEMYLWAEKLWEINENEEILRENIESTREAQARGVQWKQVYFDLAQLYWDADPAKDPGLYGFGASIYERVLVNKDKYRLDRQMYSYCANGYCSLMMLNITRINKGLVRKHKYLFKSEMEFILRKPIHLLEKYLEINPNDTRVKDSVQFFYEIQSLNDHSVRRETANISALNKNSKIRIVLPLIISMFIAITATIELSSQLNLNWNWIHFAVLGTISGIIIYQIWLLIDKLIKYQSNILTKYLGNNQINDFDIGDSNLKTHCFICNSSMTILNGIININQQNNIQGCFQCENCGRFTCYECSDVTQKCKCGATDWVEKIYLLQERI